jgi:hypothetical protein
MQLEPRHDASAAELSLSGRLTELGDELRARIRRWAERNPEGVARLLHWVFNRLLVAEEGLNLLSLVRSFMLNFAPPNWCSLPPESVSRADRLVCESGLCLIWVPGQEVVAKLLQAPDKVARDAVLVDCKAEILDSVDARLAEVMHPELAGLRALAAEAAQAARVDVPSAAQALAAAVISAVVNDHYGFSFGSAREKFETESPKAAGFWSHRRALIQRSLQLAILKSRDRPADSGFNRHLSSHGSDPSHYGEAHAIEALLLMAGALRELEESYLIAELGFAASAPLQDYAASRPAGAAEWRGSRPISVRSGASARKRSGGARQRR